MWTMSYNWSNSTIQGLITKKVLEQLPWEWESSAQVKETSSMKPSANIWDLAWCFHICDSLNRHKNPMRALAGATQLVGALSHNTKRLCVQFPGSVHMGGKQLMFLSFSLTLPLSLKSINIFLKTLWDTYYFHFKDEKLRYIILLTFPNL